ncbi:MAG TPA: phasin family protein [Steroidobacteraceae bacterium]|nr:phasin family protein [Steroidobacteraceae bacterium]
MTNTIDFTAYTDFSKRAFAPMLKLQEVSAKSFEQMAKYQYEVAGDYLHFGIDQLNAVTKAKDPAELFSKQVELASALFDKVTKRSQEFTKLVTDTQTSFANVIEETAAAPKGKKAA